MSSSSSSLPLDPPGSPPLRDNNHTDADHDNNDNDSLLLHHHPQQQPQGSNLRKNGANQLILPPNNGRPDGRQPQLPANNNNLNGKDPSLRAAPASHWNRPIDAAANAPIHQPWSSSPSSSSLWHSYQTFIQTHLTLISIAEDVLTRFVFLVPPPPHTEEHTSSSVSSSVSSGLLSVSSSSRWREVVWGLLQLHRLGVDLALANNNNNDNNAKDDHAALLSPSQQGTSVALPMPAKTDQEEEEEEKDDSSWLRWLSPSSVSLSLSSSANTMTTLRIALTVIQSLGPVTHELFRVRPTAQESVTTTTITTTTTTTSSDGHYDSAAADTMKQNLMEASQIRRHARVQCYLERLRFLLRFILLVSYWKRHFEVQRQLQQQQQQQQEEEKTRKSNDTKNHSAFLRKDSDRRCRREATVSMATTTTINTTIATSIPLGLQLDGGQYHPYPSVPVPTLAQEQARVQRRNYQGRRTGRTVTRPPPSFVSTHQMRPRTLARADNDDDDDVDDDDYYSPIVTRGTQQTNVLDHLRVMAGELLYIVRPLFQAEAEVRIHNNMAMAATSSTVLNRRKLWLLLLSWCLGLVMDTTSLWSLRSVAGIASSSSSLPYDTSANPATREEWHRRRMRLLLYLLRTPLWEQCSRPSAERLSNLLEKVPLLGGLLARYFWDWLYYWKLYRAEEG